VLELRHSSPAGEDYSFTVWGGDDDQMISTEVREAANCFDVEEHAMMLRNR